MDSADSYALIKCFLLLPDGSGNLLLYHSTCDLFPNGFEAEKSIALGLPAIPLASGTRRISVGASSGT
jgi:hypothetical protein